MIFGKTKLELKLGLFVFIGLIILATFVLSIGSFRTWTSGYRINFIFNFANGVKVGAPVRFAGIDCGEVKAIKFTYVPEEKKTKVGITCWINKDISVPCDSTIWINTLGLFGEKYIEIMPGVNYGTCLLAEQSMVGIDPLPTHELVRIAKDIISNLGKTVDGINSKEGTIGKLLYDDQIYNEIVALVVDLRKNPWKIFWKSKEKK